MRLKAATLPACLLAVSIAPVLAQSGNLNVPKTVEAGSAFSIQSSGSGKGTLYIVGLGQVIKRDVDLGQAIAFETGALYSAGHYVAVLTSGSSSDSATFDVVPASKAADVAFFAKPSRLPVGLQSGITGAAYVFDSYKNLITAPTPVDFQLTGPSGEVQTRTVTTRNGAAWTAMDSTTHQGADKFVARAGDVSSSRVVGQVPGDPCSLRITAQPATAGKISLETAPVKDCSGNAVPDGTIVTFTEAYDGGQSTVDVPLKRGVAKVDMPARRGALISVASGVVLGNQIRWER